MPTPEDNNGITIVEDPTMQNEPFNIEVVPEDQLNASVEPDPSLQFQAQIEELKAQNQQYQTQLAELTQANKQTNGLSQLANELKAMNQPTPQEPATPDYNAIFSEAREHFYDDPVQGVAKVVNPIVTAMDQKYAQQVQSQALSIAKLSVLADPSLQGDYIKYKDEVEQTVKGMPVSESVYADALKRVRSNHIDDIISEQVAAKMAAITAQAEQNAMQNQGIPSTPAAQKPANIPFTNATQTPVSPPVKSGIRVTQKQLDTAQRWALSKGVDWRNQEEKAWAINYLKDRGVI